LSPFFAGSVHVRPYGGWLFALTVVGCSPLQWLAVCPYGGYLSALMVVGCSALL